MALSDRFWHIQDSINLFSTEVNSKRVDRMTNIHHFFLQSQVDEEVKFSESFEDSSKVLRLNPVCYETRNFSIRVRVSEYSGPLLVETFMTSP
jgi:hypothetical protein